MHTPFLFQEFLLNLKKKTSFAAGNSSPQEKIKGRKIAFILRDEFPLLAKKNIFQFSAVERK